MTIGQRDVSAVARNSVFPLNELFGRPRIISCLSMYDMLQ